MRLTKFAYTESAEQRFVLHLLLKVQSILHGRIKSHVESKKTMLNMFNTKQDLIKMMRTDSCLHYNVKKVLIEREKTRQKDLLSNYHYYNSVIQTSQKRYELISYAIKLTKQNKWHKVYAIATEIMDSMLLSRETSFGYQDFSELASIRDYLNSNFTSRELRPDNESFREFNKELKTKLKVERSLLSTLTYSSLL